MRRFNRIAAVVLFALMLSGAAEAVIRDGAVRGRKGLSFGSISYSFGSLGVTIRNRNSHNVTFGGSMVFLDKNYHVIARAELHTATIKRRGSRRYKAFFSEGSGHEAQAAKYLEWEF